MLRTALIWLLAGFALGGAMLTDRHLPGAWRRWLQPGHGHMLFVGWFLQFAIGVAYWLLPRKRTETQPLGYHERTAYIAVALLNSGLALRIAAEARERSGHANDVTFTLLATSAVIQLCAATIFAIQLWPRVSPRPIRGQSTK